MLPDECSRRLSINIKYLSVAVANLYVKYIDISWFFDLE